MGFLEDHEQNVTEENKALTVTTEKSASVLSEKKSFWSKLKIFWSKPKNRIIVEIVFGVIIIAVVGLVLWRWSRDNFGIKKEEPVKSTVVGETAPTPETGISILDGTAVPKDLANRHPLAVVVENHVDARPQSGLSAASIVYEGIAEGGITRYLALFSGYNAAKIGPIRSARTYFVDIAKGFGAYFSHVGGNYDALQMIKDQKILDLDQFANGSYYYRDNSRKVATEHTMYSSTDRLYNAASKKNYTTANSFTPLKFKVDTTAALRPVSQKVSIEFGSSQYKDTFTYDPANNNYQRSIGGLADLDVENGKRIAPKNLILQEVTRQATTTAINEKGYIFGMEGSGKATIFQDGKQTIGTWKHASNSDRTIYYDAAGVEIQLNPGQTWICLTHADLKVTVE